MIKVKMYGKWYEYKNKQDACNDLVECMSCSEGAEQSRYTYAFLRVLHNRKVIDTDDADY